MTLDDNGFELIEDMPFCIDFYNEEQILSKYYEEVARIVKEKTGAFKVGLTVLFNLKLIHRLIRLGIFLRSRCSKYGCLREILAEERTEDRRTCSGKSYFLTRPSYSLILFFDCVF